MVNDIPRRRGELRIAGVDKTFQRQDSGETPALSGIDLSVAPGEFVSLIGPSGCGKSTLLRLIAGLESADNGTLTLDGEKIREADSDRCLMFQQALLFPWLTVHGNVSFGPQTRGIYPEYRAEIEALLRLMGLESFAHAYPHQLSGGMAQRAALARALANRPRVLLLDEPLGALDAFTRMNLQDEILRIRAERATTMLMVTHDVDEAVYLSDRVVVMSPRPGRIERILDITLARPRARGDANFLHFRTLILKLLHFSGQAAEPSYQI